MTDSILSGILGGLAVLGLTAVAILAAADAWRTARHSTRTGDDTIAMLALCPRCDGGNPELRCTCDKGDCGKRLCDWATVIGDREFGRQLHALLESEGGDHP